MQKKFCIGRKKAEHLTCIDNKFYIDYSKIARTVIGNVTEDIRAGFKAICTVYKRGAFKVYNSPCEAGNKKTKYGVAVKIE
jgi:hypothetical protein